MEFYYEFYQGEDSLIHIGTSFMHDATTYSGTVGPFNTMQAAKEAVAVLAESNEEFCKLYNIYYSDNMHEI